MFDERCRSPKELPNNERFPSLMEACGPTESYNEPMAEAFCCSIACRLPHQSGGGLCFHTKCSVESITLGLGGCKYQFLGQCIFYG